MNKALYTKVKDRCKDTHLSEKYLKEITESIGDVVEDDSTDEELIEKTATKIVNIAKSSQGEATRWAQNAKENANQGKKGEEKPRRRMIPRKARVRAKRSMTMIHTQRGSRSWRMRSPR